MATQKEEEKEEVRPSQDMVEIEVEEPTESEEEAHQAHRKTFLRLEMESWELIKKKKKEEEEEKKWWDKGSQKKEGASGRK